MNKFDDIERKENLEDVLKIGEVIEIKGQKVRGLVFNEKNDSYLAYDGDLIKNITVGSFIKIRKGFSNVIGRIEGEYIQRKELSKEDYTDKNEKIERIIEISIFGFIDNNTFIRGLQQMPMIGNPIYILREKEIQKIFAFFKDKSKTMDIGKVIGYRGNSLCLGINNLFASHIGIFGNTGSGKSNTLAKLYTELFEKYKRKKGFKDNSEFLIIDFNGEYTNSFYSNKKLKKVYKLSTKYEMKQKDQYPISKDYFEDLEFWAIISEATDKTQKPFLKRVIREIKYSLEHKELLKNKIIGLFEILYNRSDKYKQIFNDLTKLLSILYKEKRYIMNSRLEKLMVNTNTNGYYKNDNIYFKSIEEFKLFLNQEKIFIDDDIIYKNFYDNNYFFIFEFFVRYRFIYESLKDMSNEEHISPLLKRIETRLPDLKKVFNIKEESDSSDENLKIISLVEVNHYMKKIIPMIICKQNYDLHKKNISKRKTLHLIIDEAHNILSKTSETESKVWKDYRVELFEEIIKEGRKFGVFLTVSSQRPSDISETIISQMHNYFIHRLVNSEDIISIGKTISFLDRVSYEMIPVLAAGDCIFTGTAANFPILVHMELLQKSLQPKSETIDLVEMWKNEE